MNIVIIGSAGHWGFVFADFDARQHRIVALAPGGADESMEAVMAVAQEHQQEPRLYGDYREALELADIDVVVTNPRFDRSAEVILACIQRGLPCFAEKPFATSFEQLVAIEAAWEQQPVLVYPMMSLRAEASFYAARQVVAEGKIGDIRLITAQKSYRLGQRPDFFKERAKMGGIIPWVGSHVVDLVHWFTQQPFVSVQAQHSSIGNGGYGDLEAAAVIQFAMAGDIHVNLNLDYLRPAAADSHGDDRIRLAGTKGIVEVQNDRAWIICEKGTQQLELPPAPDLFQDCLKTLQSGEAGLMGKRDGFIVTEACLKARLSADTQETVRW